MVARYATAIPILVCVWTTCVLTGKCVFLWRFNVSPHHATQFQIVFHVRIYFCSENIPSTFLQILQYNRNIWIWNKTLCEQMTFKVFFLFDTDDICSLPIVTGNCEAAIMSWAFDPDTQGCREFIYGGCDGNENRFDSRNDCDEQCPGPGNWRFNNICNLRYGFRRPSTKEHLKK